MFGYFLFEVGAGLADDISTSQAGAGSDATLASGDKFVLEQTQIQAFCVLEVLEFAA